MSRALGKHIHSPSKRSESPSERAIPSGSADIGGKLPTRSDVIVRRRHACYGSYRTSAHCDMRGGASEVSEVAMTQRRDRKIL